jgi:hypothetical protein
MGGRAPSISCSLVANDSSGGNESATCRGRPQGIAPTIDEWPGKGLRSIVGAILVVAHAHQLKPRHLPRVTARVTPTLRRISPLSPCIVGAGLAPALGWHGHYVGANGPSLVVALLGSLPPRCTCSYIRHQSYENATLPLLRDSCLCSRFSLLVGRHSSFCNGGAYNCLHCRERDL